MFWLGVTQALEAQRIENLNIKKEEKMWFRTKQGVEYKVNDEFIGVKMTREEAIQKMSAIFSSDVSGSLRNIQDFVDGLEALELLKFEEEKKPKYITIDHCGGISDKTCTVAIADMIEALRRINIICVEKA